MSKLDKEIKPSNAQPLKYKLAGSTLDESDRKSFKIPPHGACKKLNNNRPQEPSNNQYLISEATTDDSVLSRRETSMTKFEEKSSGGVPKDFLHSVAQNTFDNLECVTEASHLEAMDNNFAPPANTSLEENVKDIPTDDVLKTYQNSSARDTSENSKSSAETSHPGMQTVQLAVCTDEIAEEKSTKKLDHLNENQDDVPEETYHDLDLKSKQSSQNIREPTEIIPRDLKHNIPEAMTHDNFIVAHGKIKPSGTTDNTSIENSTKKSICTTKEVSLNGFLSITAILILVQTYVFYLFYLVIRLIINPRR